MVVTTKVVFFYFLFNFLCLFLKKIYLGQYWFFVNIVLNIFVRNHDSYGQY